MVMQDKKRWLVLEVCFLLMLMGYNLDTHCLALVHVCLASQHKCKVA